MATLDRQLENTLTQVIAEAKIIGHFQYGHNLLQSPVQIDEIFGMIDTIIKKVIDEIDDVIPDINLAPYADGKVDPARANLCWIQLRKNYYGLILNTHLGINYRVFTDEDIQNLLLNGQCASWYLISKIQNLSYLVATENTLTYDSTIKYFKSLIIDIIERFFTDHETSKLYHPAGKVNADNLDKIISRAQIQNTNSILESSNDKSKDGTRSKSIIKTPTGDICWQSVSNLPLTFITHSNVSKIINSNYLNERADVEAFLQSTFEKRNGKNGLPNVFCFLANYEFDTPYINLNYIIESQIQGYIEVEFSDDVESRKIYPDTQPIVILKNKNNVIFVVVIKLDNDITKKINKIKMSNNNELEHLKLTVSCTGTYKKYEEE